MRMSSRLSVIVCGVLLACRFLAFASGLLFAQTGRGVRYAYGFGDARKDGMGSVGRAFGLAGLCVGLYAMGDRWQLIAESGRKPTDPLSYAFWVPLFTVFGAIVGVVLGFNLCRDFRGVSLTEVR